MIVSSQDDNIEKKYEGVLLSRTTNNSKKMVSMKVGRADNYY